MKIHGTNRDNESASVRETNTKVARAMNRERHIETKPIKEERVPGDKKLLPSLLLLYSDFE